MTNFDPIDEALNIEVSKTPKINHVKKEDTSDKKQELPPLPNLNIKEKKVESKNENKESKSGLKNKKNFKIDTSFLDND